MMFRTWKRTFDAILRSGVAVLRTTRSAKVKSVRALGARFGSSGFYGHVCLCDSALQNLANQFAFSPRLSSLRVPALD
jgi:hypothetical protein